jgi:hypothetical protein
LFQGVDRRIEIRPHPTRGSHEVMFVAKSVGLDLMPSSADLAHQSRMRYHLLAQTEEGGPERELIKPVEYGWSGLGVWTVVEGQRYPVCVGSPPPTEVAGKGADGQPLSQADHARHHVRAGSQADGDQGSSRSRPLVR